MSRWLPAPVSPPVPAARGGTKECPLTVEALTRIANLLLQEQVGMVWVEGEVSSLRIPGSGHIYFALKDGTAQVPAVIWRSTAVRLRFRLEDGQRFVMRGKLGVYPEQGRLQLHVEAAEPAGLGAAALALSQLRQALASQGLFAQERKRRLPRLPRRIGIVTSPSGAAVRDIIRTVERRFPTPILIAPTRVQGEGAAAEIAGALARIAHASAIDVIIVGRGGGSAEDLSAFNTEVVVRAIAACPVPVISAVGHEVDVTLADLAADVRAATPTAAGELAVPERAILRQELTKQTARLGREGRLSIGALRSRLDRVASRLQDPRRRFERERKRLDAFQTRACERLRGSLQRRHHALTRLEVRLRALHPAVRIEADRKVLGALEARARSAIQKALAERRRAFERAAARLDAMSPLKVLDRGYAIVLGAAERVVLDATSLRPGDAVRIRVAQGRFDAQVTMVYPQNDDER